MTDEAGAPLADVRVRVAIPAADMRFVDSIADLNFIDADTVHKILEIRSDAGGTYRLEIPGIAGRTKISIDAMKPGYRRLVGTLAAGGDAKPIESAPGGTAEASLILKPALYFKGIVVDEQGKPIPAVEVSANATIGGGSGGIERTASQSRTGRSRSSIIPARPTISARYSSKGPVLLLPSGLYRQLSSKTFTHSLPKIANLCGSSLGRAAR